MKSRHRQGECLPDRVLRCCDDRRRRHSHRPDGLGTARCVRGQMDGNGNKNRRRGPLPSGEPGPLSDPQVLRTRILTEWVRRLRSANPPVDSEREWTGVLIPPHLLVRWVMRKHGAMSFDLTQLMTGHSCFNRYLWKVDRAPLAEYSYCGPPDGYAEEVDDAHHTLVSCEAHEAERARIDLAIGLIDPGGLDPKMLERPANWETVTRFARKVMTAI